TSEYLNVNNGTFYAGRNAQRGVLNVRGLFTENCAQQFFFRSQLGFPFRCNLADQNVASTNFSADVNNTGLIEFGQCALTHVGDIGGDFFRTELGISSHTGQFLDVNGSQTVFADNTLGDQDRVFE